MPARRRRRLCRTAAARLRAAAAQSPAAPALPDALPPHPRRRVPGYQRPAVQPAEAAGRPRRAARRRAVRRRRRRPEHLRVPRRQRRQHAGVRARLRGQEPDQAGAELPLARQHSRQRQPPDLEQRQAPRQEPAHGRGAGRAGAHLRGVVRPGRGAVDHRRSQEPDGRGRVQERDRRAVPLQRAEPRDRARAVRGRPPVHRVRRPALLPARRGQARHRLPAADGQPAQRFRVPARRELPDARHRRPLDRAAADGGGELPCVAVRGRAVHDGQGRDGARQLRQADRERALRDPAAAAAGDGARGARAQHPAGALRQREGRPGTHRELAADGRRRHPVRAGRGLRHADAGAPRSAGAGGERHGDRGRRRRRGARCRCAAVDRDVAAVSVPRARVAGSGRRPGAGRPGSDPADDRALREGPGIRRRVHHGHGRRPVPAREQRARDGRRR